MPTSSEIDLKFDFRRRLLGTNTFHLCAGRYYTHITVQYWLGLYDLRKLQQPERMTIFKRIVGILAAQNIISQR